MNTNQAIQAAAPIAKTGTAVPIAQASSAPKPVQPANTQPTDSVELSQQAQELAAANFNAPPVPVPSVENLFASAKGFLSANPSKARSDFLALIAQYPNSTEAQMAQVQLAAIPNGGA